MTDTHEKDVEYWMEHIQRSRLTAGEYLKLLENFVKNGERPEIETDVLTDYPWEMYNDPILRYVVEVTHDPIIQARVLTSKMAGKVFYETMGRFVVDCLHEQQFCNQKSWSERNEMGKTCEWSMQKKHDNWQSLIAAIDEKHKKDGFNKEFIKKLFQRQGWRNEANWEKLRQEWAGALDRQMQREVGEKVRKKIPSTRAGLANMMKMTTEQHHRFEDADEAMMAQAWDLMDGQFSESEFEKKLNIVRIQNKYPEIGEVARRMGRTVEEEGRDRITVQTGFHFKIDHSSGSDIEGITVGNDINALLPMELTQYADEQLEDLFYKKYLTRRLQTFRYRSELNKPAHQLHQQRAVRNVCQHVRCSAEDRNVAALKTGADGGGAAARLLPHRLLGVHPSDRPTCPVTQAHLAAYGNEGGEGQRVRAWRVSFHRWRHRCREDATPDFRPAR